MASRIFGSGIKRREDPRLITGQAKYTDDFTLPGMAHLSVVRSPYAHARIKRIDAGKARAMPGVIGVFTGQQMKDAGFGPIPCAWNLPNSDIKMPAYPPIAIDTVRYAGNAVAIVVADDRYRARDAADAVQVDYVPLPAVVDPWKAAQPGAPQLHADVPNNVCFHWKVSGGDVEAAFGSAEVVVKDKILQQRLIPNAMEARAALAQWNQAMGELTLWVTSQNPHIVRFLLSLDTGTPEHKSRVIAPEVGGGFGSKIPHYPEDSMVIFAARMTNRPVKWTETRSENYKATIHGRDHVQEVELAAKKDGTILGLRAKVWAGLGAYLSTAAPGIPTILHGLMLSGSYKIPNIHEDVYGMLTTTTPVDAYRGAGRPEATFLVERLVELLAAELKMDPAELRRKNFIPPFTDGYTVATGLTYDTGNYEAALDKALKMADYKNLRKQQAELRAKGQYLGIGLCTYAEICGLGPSQVAGAVGFGGGLWESAIVRFHPSGKVHVMVGVSPHGQGEETTFAQVVASELGVDVDDVTVLHGDTSQTPMGWGTYGSRTTAVGSGALMGAIGKIKEKAKIVTAHLLEAAVDDIEYADGKFFVKGSPDKAKTIQDVALMANLAWNYPKGLEPGLEAAAFFDPPNFVYPFGAHIAVVEVDAETGETRLVRYIAVDDCGKVINPMIVEGQIHGGIVQGVGQALWEGAVYDDAGQLLTGTMMDYALPKADAFPMFELGMTETPTSVNPLGVKGIGETGTIAATPAVYNAVMDALAPLGVKKIDMPLTPERVWRAIRAAKGELAMYAASFEYFRPKTLAEAVELLKSKKDAKALAGGHSLLPAMKLRVAGPGTIVDIGRLEELAGIKAAGSALEIGALTTHAEIAASDAVKKGCAVLAEAAAQIGDLQVRNRGTIGGSLAHADPAADLPAVMRLLDARLTASDGKASREIGADAFFVDIFTTALKPGELLTRISVPTYGSGTGASYLKHRHPASSYAVVGVAALVEVRAGKCARVALAIGGVTAKPVRAAAAESALAGQAPDAASIARAAEKVREAIKDPLSDLYASGEFRTHLATVMAKRALALAAQRAGA